MFFFGGGWVCGWVMVVVGGCLMDTEKRGIECLCLSQRCPGPGKTKFSVSGEGAGGQGAAGPGWGRLGGVGAPAPFFFFFSFSADANFWSGERESLGRGMAWLLVVGRRGEGSRLMTH